MEIIYVCIVVFLLCLAVFDLFVGISNDAVNFLNSAIGARVAKFRTILFVASTGVLVGSVMSSGMMDVARHGIMNPAGFSFNEVMVIFLAVMVTDVIVLDLFNTLGMPTSTTVSLVFDLLGGTFALATIKIMEDDMLRYSTLLNTDKALSVIVAIFVSVAIAFVFGTVVQWISRVVFTFNYKKRSRYAVAVFGGIAFTALAYFIFIKGLAQSHYIPHDVCRWVTENTGILLVYTFVVSTIVMEMLHLLGADVFKTVVLIGTFALAMAFAGNDLVNFIGVPVAGLDSFNDYMANANGQSPDSYMMVSLMESARTPIAYLAVAGVIMIVAMATSKKARNVIKTSVDLSRQDEGDEMFGSSRAARGIVRAAQDAHDALSRYVPHNLRSWIDSRFNKSEAVIPDGAAFDVVRAAVSLVLASMLITIGTNYKLPLSTTYVTFMVAMGASLADRAWSRESAVFRVTGVLSVIGGWFITAGVAFAATAIVCALMFYGGIAVQVLFIAIVVFLLVKSHRIFAKKDKADHKDDLFRLIMRSRDPEIVWDLLRKHVCRTQCLMTRLAYEQFELIVDGFENESPAKLRHSLRELNAAKDNVRKYRRQQILALRKLPREMAIERNTWFHLGINAVEQYVYCLRRMLEPVKEHVDNSFNPMPGQLAEEFRPVRERIDELLRQTEKLISTDSFGNYREVLASADECKDLISVVRKRHIDRMHDASDNSSLKVALVYLNMLQESQQLLSNMRHQLRAAKKFMENR